MSPDVRSMLHDIGGRGVSGANTQESRSPKVRVKPKFRTTSGIKVSTRTSFALSPKEQDARRAIATACPSIRSGSWQGGGGGDTL